YFHVTGVQTCALPIFLLFAICDFFWILLFTICDFFGVLLFAICDFYGQRIYKNFKNQITNRKKRLNQKNQIPNIAPPYLYSFVRSEERRVGKEYRTRK